MDQIADITMQVFLDMQKEQNNMYAFDKSIALLLYYADKYMMLLDKSIYAGTLYAHDE